MKIVLDKKLKSGYTVRVLIDEDGRLAAQIANSKDEFVGQLFASEDNIAEMFERLTNYEAQLSSDDKTKITDSLKKQKSESMVLLRRQLNSL